MSVRKLFLGCIKTPVKRFSAIVAAAGLAFSAHYILSEPVPVDLSKSPFALTGRMLHEWEEGDLIVFVRHLERCSRVDAACLEDEANGITERSTVTGLDMREHFATLGLHKTDMYSSPLTRTAQTSALLFAEPVAHQDFLYQCEEDFVQNAVAKKTPGRNLVLVTHSSCLDEVNEHLALAEVDYNYGVAVFLNVESPARQQVLGFIDSDDWAKILRPQS